MVELPTRYYVQTSQTDSTYGPPQGWETKIVTFDRETADAAPRTECQCTSLERHAGRQDRQRQGRHDLATHPLQGTGEDQDL